MLIQDIRYGLRLIARNPLFTLIAAFSLAIGIGANASVFSLADALLFRPLPIRDPGNVVSVTTGSVQDQFDKGVSYPNYRDLREQLRSFDGLIAFQSSPFSYAKSEADVPRVRAGMIVTDNFFKVLGVQPVLGRDFLPQEGEVPGRDAVVVLDYAFWSDQFNRNSGIVGSVLHINGIDFNIIGVASQSFTGADPFVRPSFYVPAMMIQRLSGATEDPLQARDNRSWRVLGRLARGVSQRKAQAELEVIWSGIQQSFPASNRNRIAFVESELQARMGQRADTMIIPLFLVLSGVVLLIACSNVANLLLGRAQGRSYEMALRLALGCGRSRLLRQLLTESLLLSLIGALFGIILTYGGIQFIRTFPAPDDLAANIHPQLDYRVLAVCMLAAVVSTLFFGLFPAWSGSRTELTLTLKNAVLEPKHRMLGRTILIIGQIALSMVLLICTGILVDAFRKSLVMNPGFRTDHLMTMKFNTSLVRYSSERSINFYRDLVTRAQGAPGIRSVSLAASIPFSAQDTRNVIPAGYQFPTGQETISVMANVVDQHYFQTLGTEILRGRSFTVGDKEDSPRVVIVNEEFAKRYWPHEDAIGKRLQLNNASGPWLEVVGIAKTSKYLFIAEPPSPFIYLPFAQNPSQIMILVAESYGDPSSIATPLINLVHSLDINQPVYDVRTFSNFYTQTAVRVPMMILQIVSVMGLMGFALALVGIYGLVSYWVACRTKEIGIRIAIGASRLDILGMVLRQGLTLAASGTVLGGLLSVAAAQVLASGLRGIGSPTPTIFLIVPAAMLLVITAACYIPARRASMVDPILAVRYE